MESVEQPLEGDFYTKKQPDLSYMESMKARNNRLQNELKKRDDMLLDTQTAYKEMIAQLRESTKLQKEQIALIKLQRPQGKMYEMTLTLSTGAKLAHIDFIAGNLNNMSVLPANTNMDFPFSKLYSLLIINDGPANIVYSTNETRQSTKATSRVFPNESENLGIFPFPTFETLNVALESGSTQAATIRIRGLA